MLRYFLAVLCVWGTYLGSATLFNKHEIGLPWAITVAILCVLVFADHALTWHAVGMGAKERNPFAAFLFGKIGMKKTSLLLWVVMGGIIAWWWPQMTPGGHLGICVGYLLIPINNAVVIIMRKRAIRRWVLPTAYPNWITVPKGINCWRSFDANRS